MIEMGSINIPKLHFCISIFVFDIHYTVKEFLLYSRTLNKMISVQFILLILGYHIDLLLSKEIEVDTFISETIQDLDDVKSFKCKSSAIPYLLFLRDSSGDHSLLCSLKALRSKNVAPGEQQLIWMILYGIFKEKNLRKKTSYALKQATSHGKNVHFKKSWYFLGPFQIGKIELDGDPIKSFDDIILRRWDKKASAYSELKPSGIVKWSEIRSNSDDTINVHPDVNWNDFVMSLQSMAITEWQGLLVNTFAVLSDASRLLIQCLGVNYFYIDDSMYNGDIYHRSEYWYPLLLDAGIHTIKAFVRAKGHTSVQCRVKLQRKDESGVQVHRVSFAPDLVDGNWFSHHVAIVVSNWSPDEVVKVRNIEVETIDFDSTIGVEIIGGVVLQPGQVGSIPFRLIPNTNNKPSSTCPKSSFRLSVKIQFTKKSKTIQVPLTLRCRDSHQSFLFTFQDHDGSIQHAAAIRPLTPCSLPSCPVLLTLHGTGVKAENQADSYKRMVQKKFVFGVEKLWVLAPTRFGAHNWEGPGELTSLTALKVLSVLTQHALWLNLKPADAERVVIAGHSMGGHGAWQLSVHHPDKTLAVISAAGWLSKEDYGDSNVFYRHDVSISHTDPLTKSVQESCVAENQADKHASNLRGIPVMIRIGADDKTVHPYFSRRMFRLLKENRVNVTYKEFPGKEHWWWDTKTANDGGVTNDPLIRKFSTYVVERLENFHNNNKCLDTEEDCNGMSSSMYSKHQESRTSGEFTFTVYNPASYGGGRGVRVIQQKIPLRVSKYTISIDQSHVHITTSNIRSIALYEPSVDPIGWKTKHVTINGATVKELHGSPPWRLCSPQHSFHLCGSDGDVRLSSSYGPSRRIAEHPFVVVVCEGGSGEDVAGLMRSATLLANLFHITSDARTNIFSSRDISQDEMRQSNVILMGTDTCIREMGVQPLMKFTEHEVELGECVFRAMDVSALYLQPQKQSERLMLVMTSFNVQGISEFLLKLALPTIPPMVRSPFSNMVPDYVIMDGGIHTKGPGGYICTGFWNNQWNFDAASSSCVC